MLCTHGHGDHIGDAVEIAKKHNPECGRASLNFARWLGKKGASRFVADEQRRHAKVDDIKVTMVHADHSCGIQDGDQILYGGEASATSSNSTTA